MRSPILQSDAITHDPSLRRGLSSPHVVGIVVSAVVGTGIFIRSASMMQDVGSAPLLIAAWIAAGLLSLAGALSFAELCTLMPRAGGEYVFLREAFGGRIAFLFGWMRFVLGGGMSAAMAVGVATFLTDAFSLSTVWSQTSLQILQFHYQLAWGPRQVIALTAIGILAALNCRNVRTSGTTQFLFAGFKVAVLVVLIVAALLGIYSHGARTEAAISAATGSYGGFGLAVLGALQAYNGWVNATMLGGEVADSGRNYARSIIVGTVIVITLYVLVNIGYVTLLSPSEIASSNSAAHPEAASVAVKLARLLFGPSAGALLSVIFAVGALGALHGNLFAIPRVFYTMARDGLFFPALAHLDQRTSVPRAAIVYFSIWAAALTLIGGFDRLSNMAIFGYYVFYCCSVLALVVLRRRWADRERPFSVPGYPWIPLAFLASSLAMLGAAIYRGSPDVIWALILLALGLPAYRAFRRLNSPAAVGPPAAA